MAGADDEIVWPFTGNDDLITAGLAPEDNLPCSVPMRTLLPCSVTMSVVALLLRSIWMAAVVKGRRRLGPRSAPMAQLHLLLVLVPLLDLVLVSVNLLCGLILMRSMRL